MGRRLLEAVAAAARTASALRLRVLTTNDNLPALRLYQRAGFRLTELRPGAVEQARTLKRSIPATGHDGITIRDELDLVLELDTYTRSANRARGRGHRRIATAAGDPLGAARRALEVLAWNHRLPRKRARR